MRQPTLRIEDAPSVLFDEHLGAVLGLAPRTIRALVAAGDDKRLPPMLPPIDSRRRWAKGEVLAWLEANGSHTRMSVVRKGRAA